MSPRPLLSPRFLWESAQADVHWSATPIELHVKKAGILHRCACTERLRVKLVEGSMAKLPRKDALIYHLISSSGCSPKLRALGELDGGANPTPCQQVIGQLWMWSRGEKRTGYGPPVQSIVGSTLNSYRPGLVRWARVLRAVRRQRVQKQPWRSASPLGASITRLGVKLPEGGWGLEGVHSLGPGRLLLRADRHVAEERSTDVEHALFLVEHLQGLAWQVTLLPKTSLAWVQGHCYDTRGEMQMPPVSRPPVPVGAQA